MKAHLKRLAAPSSWPMKRKATAYIMKPKPSGYRLGLSIPVVVAVRDMLKFAKTAKEVKYVLNAGNLMINGRPVKDMKRAIGLFDLLELPSIQKSYRLLIGTRGQLSLVEQNEKGSGQLCRIIGKTTLPGSRIQLNLEGGANIIAPKDLYRTGDTLMLGSKGEIKDHLKLEKGVLIYLTGGKYVGHLGEAEHTEGQMIRFKKDGQSAETSRRFAFVIGKEKPLIRCDEGIK